MLFVVGCQRDTNVPSLQATAVEHEINDEGSAQPTTRVLLAPQADGFFDCPMLSLNNVEPFIAEINERDIRKLKLKPHDWPGNTGRRSVKDQLSALPKILRGCPKIEALTLVSWTLRLSDLAIAVQSENLQELSVTSLKACVFAAAPGSPPSIVYIMADELGYYEVSCLSKLRTSPT